jgi:hypothetical protein
MPKDKKMKVTMVIEDLPREERLEEDVMKKLFSCRYGSHLYGTNTPESDIDLKHVVLPDHVTALLAVKHGERSYAEVIAEIDVKLAHLQELAASSNLPENSPELRNHLEEFLLDWLEIFYSDDMRNSVRRNEAVSTWAEGAIHA